MRPAIDLFTGCKKRDGRVSKFELRIKRKQAHKRVNRWLRRFCYR